MPHQTGAALSRDRFAFEWPLHLFFLSITYSTEPRVLLMCFGGVSFAVTNKKKSNRATPWYMPSSATHPCSSSTAYARADASFYRSRIRVHKLRVVLPQLCGAFTENGTYAKVGPSTLSGSSSRNKRSFMCCRTNNVVISGYHGIN